MLCLLIHANTSGAELVELHQGYFAHGDVRDVNIMVRKDGKSGFMLVDFDWAGVIGKAHYRDNFSKVDFWLPDNMSEVMPIKSEHDNTVWPCWRTYTANAVPLLGERD
jgi:hypothetical protein